MYFIKIIYKKPTARWLGKYNKKISKTIQKICKFNVIFEKLLKNIKTKFPG